MQHTIQNNKLKLTVDNHGAEIKSLIRLSDGAELMWQADAAYWGRTSPVLFPLVGNYFEKTSIYDGKTYQMGQHGFARDMDFELVSQSDDELVFELHENQESLAKYPFAFTLTIGYKLIEDKVVVSWSVKNTNDQTMYFSIGGHPAFNCDLDTYTFRFEKAGAPVSEFTANVIAGDGSGCLSNESDMHKLDNGILKMSDQLFSKDALIIEDNQADRVTLVDAAGQDVLSVVFTSPLFGVWSPVGKHAPFVCIEPWYGRCDRVGYNQKLETREYSNALSAGETFKVDYSIVVK